MRVRERRQRAPHQRQAGVGRALREIAEGIRAAEVSPELEVRRGRRFISLYGTALILAGVAFGALVVLARTPGPLLRVDLPVARALQGIDVPSFGWVLTHVSDLGYFPLNWIAYIVVFAAFFALQLRLEAVLAVGVSLMAGLLGEILRGAVGRQRPTGDLVHVARHISGYGFPSGHVIQYTTLFGFVCYVILATWRRGVARGLAIAVLAAPIALVGPSRVYLGAHWPSDTLGAYLLAGIWLAGAIWLHLALKPRPGGWWGALR